MRNTHSYISCISVIPGSHHVRHGSYDAAPVLMDALKHVDRLMIFVKRAFSEYFELDCTTGFLIAKGFKQGFVS